MRPVASCGERDDPCITRTDRPQYDVDNFVVICVFYFLIFLQIYDIIYIENEKGSN